MRFRPMVPDQPPSPNLLIVGTSGGAIKLIDLATADGRIVGTLSGAHSNPVSVAMHPSLALIVSLDVLGTVCIWNSITLQCDLTLLHHIPDDFASLLKGISRHGNKGDFLIQTVDTIRVVRVNRVTTTSTTVDYSRGILVNIAKHYTLGPEVEDSGTEDVESEGKARKLSFRAVSLDLSRAEIVIINGRGFSSRR